jgi:hypothetical protein
MVFCVFLLLVLLTIFNSILIARRGHKRETQRLMCINNLKSIGFAYRMWANDNKGRFPASEPMTNGGWEELLARPNAGIYCWTNYAIMANELGAMPTILTCPSDERRPTKSFAEFTNNNSLSYFVGAEADFNPKSILGGDRNLGPGALPDSRYGYSPANGMGNDIVIKDAEVCWSLKMHSDSQYGPGNLLLGDGSAYMMTSGHLRLNYLKAAQDEMKRIAGGTNSRSIRIIFP